MEKSAINTSFHYNFFPSFVRARLALFALLIQQCVINGAEWNYLIINDFIDFMFFFHFFLHSFS
jgi:hypothetical protein